MRAHWSNWTLSNYDADAAEGNVITAIMFWLCLCCSSVALQIVRSQTRMNFLLTLEITTPTVTPIYFRSTVNSPRTSKPQQRLDKLNQQAQAKLNAGDRAAFEIWNRTAIATRVLWKSRSFGAGRCDRLEWKSKNRGANYHWAAASDSADEIQQSTDLNLCARWQLPSSKCDHPNWHWRFINKFWQRRKQRDIALKDNAEDDRGITSELVWISQQLLFMKNC